MLVDSLDAVVVLDHEDKIDADNAFEDAEGIQYDSMRLGRWCEAQDFATSSTNILAVRFRCDGSIRCRAI